MSPWRPEQASVLVHHSWYSSSVGTDHARSTGASGAASARGRAHPATRLERTAEYKIRRIIRLQDRTFPHANRGKSAADIHPHTATASFVQPYRLEPTLLDFARLSHLRSPEPRLMKRF